MYETHEAQGGRGIMTLSGEKTPSRLHHDCAKAAPKGYTGSPQGTPNAEVYVRVAIFRVLGKRYETL